MLKTIRNVIIGILAVLGVVFIIFMLLPDDEDEDVSVSQQTTATSTNDQSGQDTAGDEDEDETPVQTQDNEPAQYEDDEPGEGFAQASADSDEPGEGFAQAASGSDDSATAGSTGGNTVTVNIPASELSGGTVRFKTLTLDNEEITQDVFSDYDITIVHVWGTYCQPCISEMGDYAELYRELPDNVNLIAIVCDVYDGIDRNVSAANSILGDAGAEFVNLRTSDDIYDLIAGLQYIPSSFFVDRDGHLIGAMLNGASYSDTVAKLADYLE